MLLQRVKQARVEVDGGVVGAIDVGLLAFVGVLNNDSAQDAVWLQDKLLALRIFADNTGKMNLNVKDAGGAVLLVSQFTLCADTSGGTRPSFASAMAPDAAKGVIDAMAAALAQHISVHTGRFGAHMNVHLHNDGPVTVWLDSKARR